MRRLPKDGRYPEFPSSDEDSEFTPSKEVVLIARILFVIMAMIVILGLCGLVLVMINGIRDLGSM